MFEENSELILEFGNLEVIRIYGSDFRRRVRIKLNWGD